MTASELREVTGRHALTAPIEILAALTLAADEIERLQARIAKLEEERDGKIELTPETARGGIRA